MQSFRKCTLLIQLREMESIIEVKMSSPSPNQLFVNCSAASATSSSSIGTPLGTRTFFAYNQSIYHPNQACILYSSWVEISSTLYTKLKHL